METANLPVMVSGLIIGLTELLLSLIAFKEVKRTNSAWLFWFATGTAILGVGHLVCKVIGHGILSLPINEALGVFFKTVGLSMMIYSVLNASGFKWMRLAFAVY